MKIRVILEFSRRATSILFRKYSLISQRCCNQNKILVSMQNKGNAYNGFADRLRIIMASYKVAKFNNREFKIFSDGDFPWLRYFTPNQVDWIIKENEISYNIIDSFPIWLGQTVQLFSPSKKQLHVYGTKGQLSDVDNFYDGDEWRFNFEKLFSLSDISYRLLKKTSLYDKSYVAIHLRFLNCLKINEPETLYYGTPLPTCEQQLLKQKTWKVIRKIFDNHPDKEIVLFSDTESYLVESSDKLHFCTYVKHEARGHIAHDLSEAVSDAAVVDFLLIGRASIVYSICLDNMYSSGFVKYAAMIGGKKYIQIRESEL